MKWISGNWNTTKFHPVIFLYVFIVVERLERARLPPRTTTTGRHSAKPPRFPRYALHRRASSWVSPRPAAWLRPKNWKKPSPRRNPPPSKAPWNPPPRKAPWKNLPRRPNPPQNWSQSLTPWKVPARIQRRTPPQLQQPPRRPPRKRVRARSLWSQWPEKRSPLWL